MRKTVTTRKYASQLIFSMILAMLLMHPAIAQDPDDQFWSGSFSSPGASGQIGSTIVWEALEAPEGVYVAGQFTYLDGTVVNNIALWDGTDWQPLGDGLINSSGFVVVYELVLDGTDLYVGGQFNVAGSTTVSNIAVWDTQAKEWSDLGGGVNSTVNAILIEGNNVYVGGNFTQAGGNAANRIARFDGTNWSPLGSGMNSTVTDIETKGGILYAGGSFTQAGGNSAARLATWNGTTWAEFEGGANSTVRDIAFVDTSMYIAGSFSEVDGTAAPYIARWDGSAWNALPTSPNGTVYDITNTPEGLLVGGQFSQVGISSASGFARWDGSAWQFPTQDLIWQFSTPAVLGFAPYQGGYIMVGAFDGTEDETYNHLSNMSDGLVLSAITSGANKYGINGPVLTSQVHSSTGDLYVGGSFQVAGNKPASFIARWTGTDWATLGDGVNGNVWSILIEGDIIYVGGSFSEAGGQPASNIAGYDINTESWFTLGSGTNDTVYSLYKVGDNLFVGGSFSTAGGSSASRIARWNTDTENWASLSSGMNSTVETLAESGGLLLAGGSFTTAGGNSAERLASWNGTSWSEFQGGANNTVRDLIVDGSSIYAAGAFSSIGGTSVNNIAMWDGSAWVALGPGLDSGVFSMAMVGDTMYVGGAFENAGVTEVNRVAGWDGTAWFSLGSGIEQLNFGSIVYSLSADEWNLYVGGQFFEAGDKTSTNFAVWDLTRTPVSNENIAGVPDEYLLNQNYPNPFNPSTTISYTIPKSGAVTLKVYNLMGQEMATLVDGVQSSGDYSIDFDASGFSSGVYFYQLFADGATVTKRMTLIK